MKADLAAGKCDKNGKPTGVNSLTATGDAAFPASDFEHHPNAADDPCVLAESLWQ